MRRDQVLLEDIAAAADAVAEFTAGWTAETRMNRHWTNVPARNCLTFLLYFSAEVRLSGFLNIRRRGL